MPSTAEAWTEERQLPVGFSHAALYVGQRPAEGEGEIARVRFVSLSLPNKRSLCRGGPSIGGRSWTEKYSTVAASS
jgi:hypothetical protein